MRFTDRKSPCLIFGKQQLLMQREKAFSNPKFSDAKTSAYSRIDQTYCKSRAHVYINDIMERSTKPKRIAVASGSQQPYDACPMTLAVDRWGSLVRATQKKEHSNTGVRDAELDRVFASIRRVNTLYFSVDPPRVA